MRRTPLNAHLSDEQLAERDKLRALVTEEMERRSELGADAPPMSLHDFVHIGGELYNKVRVESGVHNTNGIYRDQLHFHARTHEVYQARSIHPPYYSSLKAEHTPDSPQGHRPGYVFFSKDAPIPEDYVMVPWKYRNDIHKVAEVIRKALIKAGRIDPPTKPAPVEAAPAETESCSIPPVDLGSPEADALGRQVDEAFEPAPPAPSPAQKRATELRGVITTQAQVIETQAALIEQLMGS